jgi:hypothetical protein
VTKLWAADCFVHSNSNSVAPVGGDCHCCSAAFRNWVNKVTEVPEGSSHEVSKVGWTQREVGSLTRGWCELAVACGSSNNVGSVACSIVNRGCESVAGRQATVPGMQDLDRGRVSVAGGRSTTVPVWQDLGGVNG